MNKTPIEWTTFSANPVKFRTPDGRVVWACEKLSPGCKNCYAESLSHRYGGVRRAGEWNAATMAMLTPFLDEREMHKMRTAKMIGGVPVSGSRCFLGDMTDIFGEWVPDDLLNRLFSQVLEIRTDVTWQLLTKRADRLHRYLSWRWGEGRIPSRHIHVGVSVEDQPRANERIPELLQTPAAVRFLSCEPLLAHLNVIQFLSDKYISQGGRQWIGAGGIHWGIVGCESGHDRRNQDAYEAQARALLNQFQSAGVAAFHKQMPIKGRVSGEVSEFPLDLQIREFPSWSRGSGSV
jgi:protein gp37